MKDLNQRVILLALVAFLTVFAGCKGESPTDPGSGGTPPGTGGSGGSGGGGTPPPTNPTITVSVSNSNPLVSSTTTISATVTQNGASVPNGTAVEFATTFGTFTDTGNTITLRTTTGGVATAILTSAVAGPATVTVRIGAVSETVRITFTPTPPPPPGPPPPPTTAVTSVSPLTGRPEGGEIVTIRGTNFQPPVRVLFGDQPATVLSVSETEIRVLTPRINLAAPDEFREVIITVINGVETSGEVSVTAPAMFRYQLTILTPTIFSVSPSSGPNEGNTRIVITGSGFQGPVKVYFGSAGGAGGALTDQVELDVNSVTFNQIIATTPPALGLAVALRSNPVTVRVQNVTSNTDAVLAGAFRYGPTVQITAVGPTQGDALSSTRVEIDGQGFDEPVAVGIGGIAATPVFVSGTRIIAQTGLPTITSCSNISGPISVTNIEDGGSDDAAPLTFTFVVPRASISSIIPNTAGPGSSITVTVVGTSGSGRIVIGGRTASVVSSTLTISPTGQRVATFVVTVPSTLVLQTVACPAGGTRPIATSFDVVFTDTVTTCIDTAPGAFTLTPPATPDVFVVPSTLALTAITPTGGPGGTTGSGSFVIVNTGNAPLIVSSITAGPTPPFTASSAPLPQTLLPCGSMPVTVTFNPPAPGMFNGSVTVTTNAGNPTVSLTGTATAAPVAP